MTSDLLQYETDELDAIQKARRETSEAMRNIRKNWENTVTTMDEQLKVLDDIKPLLQDLRDRLEGIENCLLNKGFLEEKVQDNDG